ncbi:MAG: HisA/HisF-related TIM barrel protein, partial [Candidatus Hodgkinia cicadicola]
MEYSTAWLIHTVCYVCVLLPILWDLRGNIQDVPKGSRNCFIPLLVGGGVRRLKDVELLLRAGADKVAI